MENEVESVETSPRDKLKVLMERGLELPSQDVEVLMGRPPTRDRQTRMGIPPAQSRPARRMTTLGRVAQAANVRQADASSTTRTHLPNFCEALGVELITQTEKEMEFDMIGIEETDAYEFWRIVKEEIPTMAIDRIFVHSNTSFYPEDHITNMLSLIPIRVDPNLFEFAENNIPNEKNTIVFSLCLRSEEREPIQVSSNDLKWMPYGPRKNAFQCSQESLPGIFNKPISAMENIPIVTLRHQQEIHLEAYAIKGLGRTDIKWAPVTAAYYGVLPKVLLVEDVEDNAAEELKRICPENVFDIEDAGNGKKRASVGRPRNCTFCQKCIAAGENLTQLKDRIFVSQGEDHYNFVIKSKGILPARRIYDEAVKIWKNTMVYDKTSRIWKKIPSGWKKPPSS